MSNIATFRRLPSIQFEVKNSGKRQRSTNVKEFIDIPKHQKHFVSVIIDFNQMLLSTPKNVSKEL